METQIETRHAPAKYPLLKNDIKFLLARYERRFKAALKIPALKSPTNFVNAGYLAKRLVYDSAHPFNTTLHTFVLLKEIEVLNTRKVYFSSFNGVSLERLSVENARHFSTEDAVNIKTFLLELKGLTLDYQELVDIIRVVQPRSLLLSDVVLTGTVDWPGLVGVLGRILNLQVVKSTLCKELFCTIIAHCGIRYFEFAHGSVWLAHKRTALNRTVAIVTEIFRHMCLDRVEMLHVISISPAPLLSERLTHLTYLHLQNIYIDLSLVRILPSLRGIILTRCTFDPLCFYELVRSQAATLRSLSIGLSPIPLDSFIYMERTLSDCLVKIPDIKTVYIAGK